MKPPLTTTIRARRKEAGITQAQASALIHASVRAWQAYEAGDRRMHPGLWALFKIRTPIGL